METVKNSEPLPRPAGDPLMAERKSKPRKRKEDDEEEPTGWARVKQSPWFLFSMIILAIIIVVLGLFALSQFLSAA